MRKMKDSKIEWVGEIPESWESNRIKYRFSTVGGNGFSLDLQGNEEGDYPFCKASDISEAGKAIDKAHNFVTKQTVLSNRFNIIPAGSIVFAKIGEAMKKNNRSLCLCECCIDNNCQALTPNQFMNAIFAYYFLKCVDMSWFDNAGTIPCISIKKLMDSRVVCPPLEEQQRIADFLDRECERIDGLKADIEAQIETLEKYKRSVITEAVTQGLNPDAPMKDSGVPWIGNIPAKWENCKLKNICSIYGRIGFRGYTQADLVDEDEGAITLSPSNMQNGKMIYDKCSFLSWYKYHESPEIQINNGDILFVKTGSTYGKTSIVENLPMEATINPQIVVIKEVKVNKKYLYYYLLTPIVQAQVECAVIGGTIPTIAQSKILNFTVFVPPFSEQQAIADYLDEMCAQVDELISQKQSQIETLETYKKSLIFEYVTGKKEVV